jgi:anti-anti-sigma factor
MAVFVSAPQLDVQTRAEDEHWLVEVRGGIDLSNVDALEAELRRLSDRAIVLDLSQVDFIDCTGVALMFRAAGRFTVGAVSSAAERVLRLCDFEMDRRYTSRSGD